MDMLRKKPAVVSLKFAVIVLLRETIFSLLVTILCIRFTVLLEPILVFVFHLNKLEKIHSVFL